MHDKIQHFYQGIAPSMFFPGFGEVGVVGARHYYLRRGGNGRGKLDRIELDQPKCVGGQSTRVRQP
jgi:hypothetical protein